MLRFFQLPRDQAKRHRHPSTGTLFISYLKSRSRNTQLLHVAPLAILIVTCGFVAASHAQSPPENAKLQIVAEPLAYVLPEIKSLPGEDTAALLQVNPRIEWDRVSVFATHTISQPELRSDIATLFNYQWQPDKDAAGREMLFLEMPPSERILEQKLWRQTMDRALKPAVELGKYARLSVSHWQQAQVTFIADKKDYWGRPIPGDTILRNGNLERLRLPFTHAGIAFIGALTPDQLRSLADTGRLAIPWAAMSGEQQALAMDSCIREPKNRFVQDLHALTQDEAAAEDKADMEWVRRTGIVVTANKDAATGAIAAVAIGRGDIPAGVGLFAPVDFPASLLAVRGSPYNSGKPDIRGEAATASRSAPIAINNYAEFESEPFPADVAKAVGEKGTWPQILAALSHSTDRPILSDAFTAARSLKTHSRLDPEKQSPALAGMSMAKGLDALCEANGYLWWHENGALFFRSRTWFIEQLYEVPPPVLNRLSKQTYGGTRLTVDAVDTLASLTQHQLEGLAGLGAVRTPLNSQGNATFPPFLVIMDLTYIPAVLDLWAELNSSQKHAILSDDGMAVSELTDRQHDTYLSLLTSRFGRQALESTDPPRVKFSAIQERSGIATPARDISEQSATASISHPSRGKESLTNSPERADRQDAWVSLPIRFQFGERGMFRLPLSLPSANGPQF